MSFSVSPYEFHGTFIANVFVPSTFYFFSLIQRDAAIEVFRKSGLPEPVLLSIFALADDDHDGVLAPKEFCVAFHLIVCLRSEINVSLL